MGFPRGSRGEERSSSSAQNLDQRESSAAQSWNLLFKQPATAVSVGPNFDRISWISRAPTLSKPISTLSLCQSSLGFGDGVLESTGGRGTERARENDLSM